MRNKVKQKRRAWRALMVEAWRWRNRRRNRRNWLMNYRLENDKRDDKDPWGDGVRVDFVGFDGRGEKG